MDAKAILEGLNPGRASAFDRWLDEDAERTEQFWAVMEGASTRRVGIDKAIAAWNAAADAAGEPDSRCPVKYNQVRVALRQREAARREVA